jgi:hypothetical protein
MNHGKQCEGMLLTDDRAGAHDSKPRRTNLQTQLLGVNRFLVGVEEIKDG